MAKPEGDGWCFEDAGLRVFRSEALVAAIWREPTVERLREVGGITDAAIKLGKIGLLVVVKEGCPRPDDAFRQENRALLRRQQAGMWGVATVIEGDSLRSIAARFIVTAIAAAANVGIPQRTFGASDEALGWLGQLGVTLDPVRLPAAWG